MSRLSSWIKPRLRLWAIYRELGYVPWQKPREVRQGKDGGIFKGTGETIIPFLNDDAKRTISQLFLRPGYMIRDYIRGDHEHYLAPFTALLVFYSVFTLLMAVVQPGHVKKSFSDGIVDALQGNVEADFEFNGVSVKMDSTTTDSKADRITRALAATAAQSVVLTHLDLYPDQADTPWKESLAAVEGDLRSKGIPMFLGNFLLLWLAMVWLLRKKHGVSVSGAAAASGYVLCQFCVFMFLALLVTLGRNADLGVIVMGILLFIDYRQWLGVGNKESLKLTIKTGLIYLLISVLFYVILGLTLIVIALIRA